jgi:hypothetical protein
MVTAEPHVLIEMKDEPDCRFVAAWLTSAATAQDLWSEALKDRDFEDQVLLLHIMGIPDLAAAALEMLGELEHRCLVAALELYADENGLGCIEFSLLVQLGFFIEVGGSYHVALPETVTRAKVEQAALNVLASAEDEGDGLEILRPERLLQTQPKAEAEQSRLRLIEMRRFDRRAAAEGSLH